MFGYLKNKKPAVPCPAGCRMKVQNELVWEGNNMLLKKVGEIDVQAQIESYRDGVDLGKMIARFKRGDAEALNRCAGQYMDVTDFPTDLRDSIDYARNVAAMAQTLVEPEKTAVEQPNTESEVNTDAE